MVISYIYKQVHVTLSLDPQSTFYKGCTCTHLGLFSALCLLCCMYHAVLDCTPSAWGWGSSDMLCSGHIPCLIPSPDLIGPRPDLPDFLDFSSNVLLHFSLLTHSFHVTLGPHPRLHLPPDVCSTPLCHPIYPSALLTLFMFTRLHPFLCTGLRLLSLLTGLQLDLLFQPDPLSSLSSTGASVQ